jgi:hypothetical protein
VLQVRVFQVLVIRHSTKQVRCVELPKVIAMYLRFAFTAVPLALQMILHLPPLGAEMPLDFVMWLNTVLVHLRLVVQMERNPQILCAVLLKESVIKPIIAMETIMIAQLMSNWVVRLLVALLLVFAM